MSNGDSLSSRNENMENDNDRNYEQTQDYFFFLLLADL